MQSLFPIIRRVRRPLLVLDTPPVVVGNVEPVDAVAVKPAEVIISETAMEPNHAQSSDQNEPR